MNIQVKGSKCLHPCTQGADPTRDVMQIPRSETTVQNDDILVGAGKGQERLTVQEEEWNQCEISRLGVSVSERDGKPRAMPLKSELE